MERPAGEDRDVPRLGVSSARTERVPVNLIRDDDHYQVRLSGGDSGLDALADSLRRDGLICPPLLLKSAGGYRVIAGFRRVAAARKAGLKEIESRVLERVGEGDALRLGATENLLRRDLSPLELALTIHRLSRNQGCSYADVTKRFGIRPKTIQRLVRIVEHASPSLRSALERGTLTYSQALPILRVPPEEQSSLTEQAVAREWSKREVEERVRALLRKRHGVSRTTEASGIRFLPPFARPCRSEQPGEFAIKLAYRSREELGEKLLILLDLLGGSGETGPSGKERTVLIPRAPRPWTAAGRKGPFKQEHTR